MSRIADSFAELSRSQRKGLITFITAGDPDLDATPGFMHALVRGGADIIELGVPFSDPMADGETIQRASERALAAGASLGLVLDCVANFRAQDKTTPVVLMGYLNPIERMGSKTFAQAAHKAGVDGLLVVDAPPEEALELNREVTRMGLDQIFLVAPNSSESRIARVCELASGFVYFVAVKGVTGGKAAAVGDVQQLIETTRAMADLPVGIGFGIRTPEAAARAAAIADAIIVGSALVELIESNAGSETGASAIETFTASLREAIDA